MGIKDLRAHNTALILKLGHKVFSGPNNPMTNWFRGRYLKHTVQLLPRSSDTPTWKLIISQFNTLSAATQVTLGNGKTTLFWKDNWLHQRLQFTHPILFSFALDQDCTVDSQFTQNSWHVKLHPNLSYQAELELHSLMQILHRFSPIPETPDTRVLLHPAPKFSTSNAYQLLTYHGTLWKPTEYVWIHTIPQNCKIFLWLAFKDRLNTKANMVNKCWSKDPHCPLCPALESADHIIQRCKNANSLWEKMNLLHLANHSESSSAFLQAVVDRNHSNRGIEPIWFAACAYTLWKARNNMIFERQNDNL